ncbi:MAG: nucleoprotein [hymenopteran phasma-related virus OKIAV252]|uniref:nucleoprotein n=1 Tax=hymenopteran phasma-related virus OKIAV252 TaxID=2847802 RepID=UPI0024836ADF|nr:MAG: nucleoprotein [hymenopteran phasma-related virus OKIAV252]WBM84631.1 MAG: nucleoprotein [hymenopteran phasma-related virus OKIAV252]
MAMFSADSLHTVDVPVELKWPPGFLSDSGDMSKRDKLQLTKNHFGLLNANFVKEFIANPNADLMYTNGYDTPDGALAVLSYITSMLWKTNIKPARNAQILNVYPQDDKSKTVKIYSLKNIREATDLENKVLYDDAVHISIMLLNTLIHDIHEAKGVYVFTPLSRVLMDDSSVIQLAKHLYGKAGSEQVEDTVKALNISSARKSYQCANIVNYYNPNIAAASLIRSAMAQNATKLTKEIAERQLKKISNNDNGKLNAREIASILSMMTGIGGSVLDMEEIVRSASYIKRSQFSILESQAKIPVSYKSHDLPTQSRIEKKE